jgi:L-lactate dehydrogenase
LITKWNEAEKLGIKDEVFLSVPCVVGREGIVSLITQNLNSSEEDKLMNSIKTLHEVQKDIKL